MADDENEQTTPHWGTSAPDYEGEDPENEIELDPNMAELPLFAGLEAKKQIAIVGALYDVTTGEVKWLD